MMCFVAILLPKIDAAYCLKM